MSYDYRVVSVDRVVDGDTLDVTIDVGFRMTTQQRIRVLGVDTPERGQDGWAEATMFTSQWCEALKGRLRITTQKADSFGRYLGVIYDPSTFLGLGQALIDSGHAKVYAR